MKKNSTNSSTKQSRPIVTVKPRGIGPTYEYNINDVLCGRGGAINSHYGNIQFRKLITRRIKQQYLNTKKLDKAYIAADIVYYIRYTLIPSGRFLKQDMIDGSWWDIGDLKAIKKTGQSLLDSSDVRSGYDDDDNDNSIIGSNKDQLHDRKIHSTNNNNDNNNDISVESNFVDTNHMMNSNKNNNKLVVRKSNSNSSSSTNKIIITGAWNDDEIVRFNNAIRIYGIKDYKSIAKMVHTRNAIQVKLRCHRVRKGNNSISKISMSPSLSSSSVPTPHHDDPLETTATTTTPFPLQRQQQQVIVQPTVTQQQQQQQHNYNSSLLHIDDITSITNHETKNHTMDKYNVESVHNVLAYKAAPTDNTEACNSMNEHSKHNDAIHDFKSKCTKKSNIRIGQNKGIWTTDELQLLEESVRMYGTKDSVMVNQKNDQFDDDNDYYMTHNCKNNSNNHDNNNNNNDNNKNNNKNNKNYNNNNNEDDNYHNNNNNNNNTKNYGAWTDDEIIRVKDAIHIVRTRMNNAKEQQVKRRCILKGNTSSKISMSSPSSSSPPHHHNDDVLESSTTAKLPQQQQQQQQNKKHILIQTTTTITTTTAYTIMNDGTTTKNHTNMDMFKNDESSVHDLLTHITTIAPTGKHWKHHNDVTNDFENKFDNILQVGITTTDIDRNSSSTNNNNTSNIGHHKKGRWTKDKFERFEEGIQSYGLKDNVMLSRTPKQVKDLLLQSKYRSQMQKLNSSSSRHDDDHHFILDHDDVDTSSADVTVQQQQSQNYYYEKNILPSTNHCVKNKEDDVVRKTICIQNNDNSPTENNVIIGTSSLNDNDSRQLDDDDDNNDDDDQHLIHDDDDSPENDIIDNSVNSSSIQKLLLLSSSSLRMINKKRRHNHENILVSQLDDDDDDDDEQHMMMICIGLWQDNDKIERLHDAV